MEGGGAGGSSTTSLMMAFGDNSNGLCPLMMMMPLMSSSSSAHHQQQHVNAGGSSISNTLFLPLPATPNQSQSRINNNAGGSSSMIHDYPNNSTVTATGCYFMENSDGGGGSTSVKAKIMAHPHYHRLLAAYASCQKVKKSTVFSALATLLTKPIYTCFSSFSHACPVTKLFFLWKIDSLSRPIRSGIFCNY